MLPLIKNTKFYHNLFHKNVNIHCAKESKKNHKPHILYLETKMPPSITVTGPCVITICKRQSTNWRKVTEFIISKGQTNSTLPDYVHLGDTICLNCYNGIVTKCSAIFQQHAQTNMNETDEIEIESIPFSKAIEMITNILYVRENREKKSTLYTFYEFRAVMEREDATKWKRIYKSFEFQQHAQANETDESSSTNSILSFSKAIEVISGILYVRENEEKPTLYSFDEL